MNDLVRVSVAEQLVSCASNDSDKLPLLKEYATTLATCDKVLVDDHFDSMLTDSNHNPDTWAAKGRNDISRDF